MPLTPSDKQIINAAFQSLVEGSGLALVSDESNTLSAPLGDLIDAAAIENVGELTVGDLTVTGSLTAPAATLVLDGLTATGTVQGATVTATGTIQGASGAISGALTAGSVVVAGALTAASVLSAGEMDAASADVTGLLTAGELVAPLGQIDGLTVEGLTADDISVTTVDAGFVNATGVTTQGLTLPSGTITYPDATTQNSAPAWNKTVGGGITYNAGTVGIGVASPSVLARMQISNDSASVVPSLVDTYQNGGTIPSGAVYRTARGTFAAPTAVQSGDQVAAIVARPYGTTGFAPTAAAALVVRATENHTDGAKGTSISLATTTNGTTTVSEKLTVNGAGDMTVTGNVEIGSATPYAAAKIHISNDSATVQTAHFDSYLNGGTVPSGVVFRTARGSKASPSAVQNGDQISAVVTRGFGATDWSPTARAAVVTRATENWTDTAQGTSVSIATTAPGTTTVTERLVVDGAGSVTLNTSGGRLFLAPGGPSIHTGTGNPEGVVSAETGSMFLRLDAPNVNQLLYLKIGSGATGWAAMS